MGFEIMFLTVKAVFEMERRIAKERINAPFISRDGISS